MIVHITKENFEEEVLKAKETVLIDFWAPWCTYCRRIGPAFEKIADQYQEDFVIGKINIDEEPELARQERVEVIPTLVLYQNGYDLGSIVAPESKARIEAFLAETL